MVSGCTIELDLKLSASDKEGEIVADLLSFARQVACGMVSRCSNSILNYSMNVLRDKSAILYGNVYMFCFVGISFVKSYNSS